jgi:uncharacterized protein (DUF433 family)
MTEARKKPGLGSGIYTYYEAARLLKVDAANVSRWAKGYTYKLNGEIRRKEAILQEPPRDGLLTFYDLIELFFVREFRQAGVKLQDIRDTAKYLSDQWQTPYPFACNKLQTDGQQILLDAGDHYFNVARQQAVFRFAEDFFKNIEFNVETCLPLEWWPIGRDKLIVIDPKRSFGTPIDVKTGVRTDILYAAYKAENGDIEAVADWYEVTKDAVEAAVEFEEQWLKAA